MLMRQAITTKYLGPTYSKGSRIKATAQAGSLTLARDWELNPDEDHARVAMALVAKLGWGGQWVGGSPNGSGYVFVDMSDQTPIAPPEPA